MIVRDLMTREVRAVREDDTLEELIDLLVRDHIHGAPVVSDSGEVVGVVTQQDVFFGGATHAAGERGTLQVRDIMTAPPVTVEDSVDVRSLCEMMHRLRIHRLPVVVDGRLVGIVSSLDVCGAIASGADLHGAAEGEEE